MIESIKKLRSITGAGMSDCKKAIQETSGDIEAAIMWIRQNVTSIAKNKMSSRETKEGCVAIAINDNKYSIVEVNNETDFVSRNDIFKKFISEAAMVNTSSSVEKLLEEKISDGSTVQEAMHIVSGTLGENIFISKCDFIEAQYKNSVYSYVHNKLDSNLRNVNIGRIGVIVKFNREVLPEIGYDVAMHIAAFTPEALDIDDIPQDIRNREQKIIDESDELQSKPEAIRKQIADGKLVKILGALTLNGQDWFKDPKKKVNQILEESGAKVEKFIIYKL